jgi:hypothetical protein
MARNLARALKSDLSVRDLTEMLRRKGRGNDTVLAHISPREMKILKKHGGSGTVNPNTGLPEFVDDFTIDAATFDPTPISYQVPSQFSTTGQTGSDITMPVNQMVDPNTVEAPSNFVQSSSPLMDYGMPVQTSGSDPLWNLGTSQFSWAQPDNVPVPQSNPYAYAPQGSSEGVSRINAAAGAPTGLPANVDYSDGQTSTGLDPLQEKIIAAGLNNLNQPGGLQGILSKIDPFKAALALGGAGLGIYGASQAKSQGAKQAAAINALGQQQAALAQPILTQGGQLYGQALQGSLTATNRQAFDAARAQLAQSAANTGGVGAMQATALAENMRQQALQTQLNQGLQLIGSGDQIMNQALSTQLQAITAQGQYAQQAAAAAGNFFGALGKIYGSTV